jgi:hypothetical protein
MNRSTRNAIALAVVPAFLTTLLIQACGGSSDAIAQAASADPIEGVWESAVTIRDCATGNAIRTFKGLGVLHRGGTATATNNQPTAVNGPALGTWTRTGTSPSYTLAFRFYRYNPDGTYAGAQRLVRTVTLAASGSAFTGTIAAQVLDPTDAVLQEVCGTETATRVS